MLLTRVVGLFVSVVTATIVPRSLGRIHYGSFQFLFNAFTQIKNLFDLSASNAFFTYCSKNQKSGLVLLLFGGWEILHAVLLFALIGGAVFLRLHTRLWPDQQVYLLYLMAGVVLLSTYQARLMSFADTKALTVSAQIIKALSSLLLGSVVVIYFVMDRLSLNVFIAINCGVLFFGILLLALYLWRCRQRFYASDFSLENFTKIRSYAITYCSPMVVYGGVGFVADYFKPWFLQVINGSGAQGEYALSRNWSQIVLLFTAAMVPIFWREVSHAFGQDDMARVKRLFGKFMRLLLLLTCYFSAFICCQSEFLINRIAGDDFSGAAIPFMLMAFYPLTQTCGQLSGVMFFASEQTRLYRNLGICTILAGMVCTYFLLAPQHFLIPGLGLGATGLALQMVGFGAISVNVRIYFNCRQLKISPLPFYMHQLYVLGVCFLTAWGASRGMEQLIGWTGMTSSLMHWLGFFLSGLLYSLIIAGVVLARPAIAGLTREDLGSYWNSLRDSLRKPS